MSWAIVLALRLVIGIHQHADDLLGPCHGTDQLVSDDLRTVRGVGVFCADTLSGPRLELLQFIEVPVASHPFKERRP